MKQIQWKPLLQSISISLGVGILASIFTGSNIKTYETMYQPPLAPPGWLFPVVWTILYILMGIAAYRIFLTKSPDRGRALMIYLLQLAFNGIWPILFFNVQAYFIAFLWLLALWYFIYLTIKEFYSIDQTAGILLFPYLVWVTFAGYLNLAIAIHSIFS